MALVGASVLAGELEAAAGEYRSAFARYEQQLRGFVERNQRLATEDAPPWHTHVQAKVRTLRLAGSLQMFGAGGICDAREADNQASEEGPQ